MAENRAWRSDGRTCVVGEAEYTLCGDAMEGDNDISPVVYTRSRGPITCPGCCLVIASVRENFRNARLEPEDPL